MPLLIVLVLALSQPAQEAAAVPSDVPLSEYIHTRWTQHEGVPLGRVEAILRTGDGYLWIITRDAGLLRFDGMRFSAVSTPCKGPVTHATSTPDGGFWAICGYQLVRRTSDGRFLEVGQTFLRPRPPPVPVLLVDGVGRPWFIKDSIRYLEVDGTGGREMARPTGGLIRTAAFDADGTLWVSDQQLVVHLIGERPERVSIGNVWCLVPARDGGVFAVTPERVWRLRAGAMPSAASGVAQVGLSGAHGCMSEASDGGLWIATPQHGIALLQNGVIETIASRGERDTHVEAVFVDSEETVWVGTSMGLHRYRRPLVRLLPSVSRQVRAAPLFVFVDSKENVWISPGHDGGVSRIDRDGASTSVAPHGHAYWAIGEDEIGRIWLSDTSNIGYVENGRFVTVRDASDAPVKAVSSFKRDGRGHLWALSREVGVYRLTPEPPRLMIASPQANGDFLISDRSGIWVGLDTGGVEQHVDGRRNLFPDDQPNARAGIPRTITEIGDSVWMGTGRSLKRWRNGEFTTWTTEHGLPGTGRTEDIVVDRSGRVWMMSDGGLLTLPRAQLDAAPDGLPRRISFARIGALDGVVPYASRSGASPRATSDAAGRLFFATLDSVVLVDPAAVVESSLAPPIMLESVTVDDRAVNGASAGRFVEPSRLQFDYTSLNLRSPENARFRYRLEGYDADWIEAGAHRRVTYGTLRPGSYRFRVIGAGGEGVWNEEGASFSFQVTPVFWRTWWFRITALGMAALFVAGLFQLRVRQLTRQFNIALDARVTERTRIARELHDTLLQTFQGVLIHFQAAANLLPARPDEAKLKLDSVLDRGARAITEARDAVQGLRSHSGAPDDLSTAIGALGEELDAGRGGMHSAKMHVNVEGQPRGLHPALGDDVYRIVSEAVRNAMRHAEASTVQVDIQYDERHLRIRIRDDGKGIDPKVLWDRAASGHWGLPGMRERAGLIGGTLDVRSRIGSGTEVELSVPAARAYAAPLSGRRLWSRFTKTERGV